ncbi:hypothetical protein G5714_024629 [Onychostoma macrolepis]|uniref:Ubiquitin carboxyl-terminal hydrolase 30 n=1 Tax=Onychostoma macrolepis TaxID=369639 RepID=A0A7J6BH91_9TELE|nr:hypothetical protein G5714_024629 [Onychostoma macrolepis]
MDSSSAAPEDRDKPPSSSSSSSGKRRFKGLRRFFGRMLSFCGVSSSSEQDKSVDGPSSADRVSAQETKLFTDAALSFETIDVERLVELLASFGVQWHDLSKDSLKELLKSLEEQEEASEEKSAEEDDADQAALGALTDLHMSRMDSSDSDLKETHLAKVKSYIESHFPVFKGRCQQDAHEFFMACLSRLKEESMSLRSSHPSYTWPVSSMEFKLRSERTCNSCGLMKSFTEESNCLSLVIGPHASLTDSLQQYMNVSISAEVIILHEQEALASFIDCVCSLCGGPQASETLKFLSLPRVLVLLVQRFDFTSSMIKLKNRLEIPEELTLSCVKEAPVVISSQYRLSDVVSHAGSHLFFGHYISQIREHREDGWLRCSDASVRRSSWSEVSEDAGDNGYLLFYVKRSFIP